MAQHQTIAVLLTCFNRKKKTLDCLKSLYKTELPDNVSLDVYLVDDGSTDETGEEVKFNFPKVKVIRAYGNLYWMIIKHRLSLAPPEMILIQIRFHMVDGIRANL